MIERRVLTDQDYLLNIKRSENRMRGGYNDTIQEFKRIAQNEKQLRNAKSKGIKGKRLQLLQEVIQMTN